MVWKLGERAVPLWGGGAGSVSNAMSPEPRPTYLAGGVLIHQAICPQQKCAENWPLCPFGGGELGPTPHLIQCCLGRAYLPTHCLLDPTNRFATTDIG